METGDHEEIKTVFAALFDTCVQYLRSDVIINHNSWFSEHQDDFLEADSTGDNENEAFFRWILEDDGDTAIIQFVRTLRDLICDSGDVNSIMMYGKHEEGHWIKYFATLLDGSLIKEFSLSDINQILDIMVDKKIITKPVHKKAKEAENPHTCCQIMFQGIIKTRGKSNWPFVFLEAISTIKPDLVQPKTENMEQHDHSVTKQATTPMKNDKTMITTIDIQCQSEEFSSFSDGYINERIELSVFLSEEESKSKAIQSWLNSGHVERSCFVSYEEWHTMHAFEETDSDIGVKPTETPKIELRKYQEELAETALKGINTIICAPTGCGKTLVVVHIILTHLQEKPDESLPRKVVFCARTVPLVMQQYQVLQTFLPPIFKVVSLTGEDRNSLQLNNVIPDVDVLVMTPRILENHLIRNGQDQLDLFSLLVFDECHHTRNKEPYNMLMHYYLKRKQIIDVAKRNGKQISTKLPQIIGLTASIGVDNASDDDQATENILQICGNLDVEYITCVEKYIEELKEYVSLSKEELLTISERGEDPAVVKIFEKMKTLEGYMKKLAQELEDEELKSLLSKIPLYRKSIHYGNWVVKVKNIAKSLPRSRLGKMNNCKRLLIILGGYLWTYNVALELHDLVLLRHVMEYLQRSFNQYQEDKNSSQEEKAYFESFSELQDIIKDQLDSENSNLTQLKTCVMKYIVAKGDASRCIIFVRTRALVKAVTSWLNNCGDPIIENLRAAPFTGTSASLALGGMTGAMQKEVIQMFKIGQVRLLVATSVAEEGIDIPECSLVIKYNYTGNEITTVQTRGRSRKKGGVSVILAMSKLIEKERMNQRKAEMMERAVRQIRQMDPLEIHKKVEAHQQKVLREEEINECLKNEKNKSKRREHFEMVCHGCGDVVIDSSDIRMICQTHHIVVNWDIMKKTRTVVETDSTLFDDIRLIGPVKCRGRIEGGRHCNNKLGSLMFFSNIPFVVLGIKNFGFESVGRTKQSNYKHWKLVPYVIDEIAPQDIQRYLPVVTASESKYKDNKMPPFLGEDLDVARHGKTLSTLLQQNKLTMQDVKNIATVLGKTSFAEHPYSYSNNAQIHAMSFQALGLAERYTIQQSSRAMGGPEGSKTESPVLLSGWLNLESKLSSTGQPDLQETLPSLQRSEESSGDIDSMSTLHSDSLQKTMTEEKVENLDEPGVGFSSMAAKREEEDMYTMTSSLVTSGVEQIGAKNSSSSVDDGSEVEHLAEVGDKFYL